MSSIYSILKRYINISFSRKKYYIRGFTLSELIVGTLISTLVLVAGYGLIGMTLRMNKSDEEYMKLGSKIDNALDFVIDEINSGKRILTEESQLPKICPKPSGEFVLGIKLPSQAIDLSQYKTNSQLNKSQTWKEVECPILYSLVKNKKLSNGSSYFKLIRRGPSINEKGYYVPTNISDTLISENIKEKPIDVMKCDKKNGWTSKEVFGIIVCTDKNRKAAEIAISANLPKIINNKYSKSLIRTSGGYSRIQDEEQMGSNSKGVIGQPCSNSATCNVFGTVISSRQVTLHVDVSYSMNWGRIKGKPPIDALKEELIRSLQVIDDGVFYQIVAFSNTSKKLFQSGPKEMNSLTRAQGIQWVLKLKADGWTNPWNGLLESIESAEVGQIILVSDGEPQDLIGWCPYTNKSQKYIDCIKHHNDNGRNNSVQIDTISMKNNYCAKGWLGIFASQNRGNCSLIK